MPHHTPLISTIVVALVLAFILGAIAHRFRVSPLVGYLLAGVLIGPFTPGYVADQNIAKDLAARSLIVAIPDAFEGGQVVAQAKDINPALHIIARSHSDEETEHLKKHGDSRVIMGEHEIAMAMLADLPQGAN